VRAATGYAIGGVPPVGHARPLAVFIDRDLTRHSELIAAAGTRARCSASRPTQLCR
jgi:prolyl-tRNA editing enzyme YbaK/EbsC (Cys-tRNA(Pro) deacylase)